MSPNDKVELSLTWRQKWHCFPECWPSSRHKRTDSQKQLRCAPWKMCWAEESQVGEKFLFSCRWARNFSPRLPSQVCFPHHTLVWINLNKWLHLTCCRLLIKSSCHTQKRAREPPCLCGFWLPHKVHIQLYWGQCCSKTYYINSNHAINTTNTWDQCESLWRIWEITWLHSRFSLCQDKTLAHWFIVSMVNVW